MRRGNRGENVDQRDEGVIMIERYIYAVTKELPKNKRQEATTELRRTISNRLKKKSNQLTEDEKKREVLIELGRPKILANQYRGKERYLIGPRYFERYLFILRVVLLSIVFGLSIAHGVSVFFTVNSLSEVIGGYIGSLLSALLQGIAWVTGIFALLEYNDVTLSRKAKDEPWDPSELPPIPKKKARISRGESVLSIIFITILLTLLFFSPEAIGIYYYIGETIEFIPLFNLREFFLFRSLIFVSFTIELLLEVIKILKARWTRNLAIIVTVFNILSAAIVIFALSNSIIWNPEIISKIERYLTIPFEHILSFIATGIVVVTLIESAFALYRGFKYGER